LTDDDDPFTTAIDGDDSGSAMMYGTEHAGQRADTSNNLITADRRPRWQATDRRRPKTTHDVVSGYEAGVVGGRSNERRRRRRTNISSTTTNEQFTDSAPEK